ncbi:hypothetical protein BH09PAT1_BH09PAT1_5790 [soil metagenome]
MNEDNVIEISVNTNEEVIYPFIWMNGEENKTTIKVNLIGDNASFLLCGIFLGKKNKKAFFNTDVNHIGKNTKSLTTIRAVFFEKSSFSNDGMVRIMRGARNTDGYFQSKVLLFDDAKGRSVPSLEIDENEVKAGHGSTIGRPDQEQLFYLRSRGMSEKEAEALLVSGFFVPIINMLPKNQQKIIAKKIHSFLSE